MRKNTILIMIIAVVISGCSSKQLYDSIQKNAQHECLKLPGSTYQKCMDRYSKSFESYTQKREDILDQEISQPDPLASDVDQPIAKHPTTESPVKTNQQHQNNDL